MNVRLQKFLAEAGVASRRVAEAIILAGRVQVNGQPVQTLGTKVDPSQDTVTVDGKNPFAPNGSFMLPCTSRPGAFARARMNGADRRFMIFCPKNGKIFIL